MLKKKKLEEGIDFYFDKDTKRMTFTAKYLQDRGYCCGSGCKHCPYGFVPDKKKFVILGIEKKEPKNGPKE